MKRPLAFSLVCALSALVAPDIGFGGDDVRVIAIGFAVSFGNADPVAGSATCTLGMDCQLLQTQLPSMEISLKVDAQDHRFISRLKMRCSDECSFLNGRADVTFEQERQFEFYEGAEQGAKLLVMRPKVRIGRISLIYPKPKQPEGDASLQRAL